MDAISLNINTIKKNDDFSAQEKCYNCVDLLREYLVTENKKIDHSMINRSVNDVVFLLSEIDSSDLRTCFDELLKCLIDGINERITYFAAKLAFSFSDYLIRKDLDVKTLNQLLLFCRDDLFLLYICNREKYYWIVYAFYQVYNNENPMLDKYDFKNIENMISGKNDPGYMDIDYLHVTYLTTNYTRCFFDNHAEKIYYLKKFQNIKEMYERFRKFANNQYGYKKYNRNRANKLIIDSLEKPKNIHEKEFIKRPYWMAMAYATAEATAQYYLRLKILKKFHLEERMEEPNQHELDFIAGEKKARIRMILFLILCLGLSIGISYLYHKYAFTVFSILVFALYAILSSNDNSNKGSSIYYIGHHYIGPAWWFHNW